MFTLFLFSGLITIAQNKELKKFGGGVLVTP